MSTNKSVSQVVKEIEYWLRLSVLLQGPLKNALLQVLHNITNDPVYTGLPINPIDLYNALSATYLSTLNTLQKKRILRKDQMELLLPTNGNKTHSDKFDVTLIVVLIINCTTLPAPVNGWKTYPSPTDSSIAANVLRAREWRNFLNHANASDIDAKTFQQKWDDGINIITTIGYHSPDIKNLKTISLDPKHELVLQSLSSYLNRTTANQQQHAQDIEDCKNETQSIHKELDNQAELMRSHHELLFNQLQSISKEMDQLKKLKLQEPEVPRKERTDLSQICCREVLSYVANNIDDEWSPFLDLMSVPEDKRNKMENNDKTSSENVTDYFKSIAYQVRWTDLKQILLALEKLEIVHYIEMNTLITQGLQIASNKLKQQYVNDLLTWYIEQPLSEKDIDILREEGYIDLAILSSTTIDHEWSNSDRAALMEQNFLQFESIDIDKIFEMNDQMVVIRGVAGIGKSTLIQMYILKWAKGEILNKQIDASTIDFLFFFTCREMNALSDIESLEDLLKKKYPETFRYVNFQDLQSTANRIMIVVDGLDELQGIYEENSKPINRAQESVSNLVKDIIDTRYEALRGHKTITLGRPRACEYIKEKYAGTQKLKTIEVCGFNRNMIIKYVEAFFKNDAGKAESILELIRKSKDLKALTNVPIFLWVICMVYGEELLAEEINTVTELYVYGFLVFLQKHLQCSNDSKNRKLQDMVNDPFIGEIVFSLAKLSMKTYMKHQVIFTDQDIKTVKCPLHLEQTGFIVKHAMGKMNFDTYQFKHLAFQEFLCALNLCLVKRTSPFNTNRELSSCTPTILGIHYLRKGKKNQLFIDLYQNLKNTQRKNSTLKDSFKGTIAKMSHSLYIRNCLKLSSNIMNFICSEDNILSLHEGNTKFEEFLRNIHELGYHFSEEQLKRIKDVSGVNVCIWNLNANSAKYTLQLLEALQINKITTLDFGFYRFDEENNQAITSWWELAIDCSSHSEINISFNPRVFKYIWVSITIKKGISIHVGAIHGVHPYYMPNKIKNKFKRFILRNTWHECLTSSQEDFIKDLLTFVKQNNGNGAILIVSALFNKRLSSDQHERLFGEEFDKCVVIESLDDDE